MVSSSHARDVFSSTQQSSVWSMIVVLKHLTVEHMFYVSVCLGPTRSYITSGT